MHDRYRSPKRSLRETVNNQNNENRMQNNQHHIQHRGDALFDDALGPQVEDGMLSSNENLKDRSYRNELKDRYIDQEQIDVAVIKPCDGVVIGFRVIFIPALV